MNYSNHDFTGTNHASILLRSGYEQINDFNLQSKTIIPIPSVLSYQYYILRYIFGEYVPLFLIYMSYATERKGKQNR